MTVNISDLNRNPLDGVRPNRASASENLLPLSSQSRGEILGEDSDPPLPPEYRNGDWAVLDQTEFMTIIPTQQRLQVGLWMRHVTPRLIALYNREMARRDQQRPGEFILSVAFDPSTATASPPPGADADRPAYMVLTLRDRYFAKRFANESALSNQVFTRRNSSADSWTSQPLSQYFFDIVTSRSVDNTHRSIRFDVPTARSRDRGDAHGVYLEPQYDDLTRPRRALVRANQIDWEISNRLAIGLRHRLIQWIGHRWRQMQNQTQEAEEVAPGDPGCLLMQQQCQDQTQQAEEMTRGYPGCRRSRLRPSCIRLALARLCCKSPQQAT